jgi:amino acid adenylation domain-containing protein/thioester reductase-like protein
MPTIQSYDLIHQMFERQSLRTPDAIAVTFKGQQLTYQELDRKANQVAHYLQSLGVQQETLVGICLDRSLEMLVAMLGVLKAGGAYVPLDPSYPIDRTAFTIEDAELSILLTEAAQLEYLPKSAAQTIILDSEWESIYLYSQEQVVSDVTTDNLAYTIYTSGSTGKPKGVQVMHRSAVNLYGSMSQLPGLTAQDTLLALSSICFDMSVLELFLPLSVGAKIALVSRDVATDGSRLAAAMTASGVTMMQATPSTWQLLLATGWQGNEGLKILCGGEAMTPNLAEQLLTRCTELWNMYGPTETTVWSSLYQIKSSSDNIFVGDPIANTQIYLIDPQCRRKGDVIKQVASGQSGEILIGGDGLARGYLNRLEMTAEKFVPDPFSAKPGARLYRTGDLGRLLPDGNIQYMGRADHQVKIRGYRIELGDIDAALSQYPDIREAAVIVREDSAGEKRLVAYVVSKTNTNLGFELRGYLKEKLPEYMVPSIFVMLDAMPLTPNGKIDRRALPAPSQERPLLEQSFVAPRNFTEQKLAQIWSQVLAIYLIGINDNFFELGGDSLFVAKMMFQLEAVFQVKLPLSSFFEAPTIAGLARFIDIETANFLKLCESVNYQPILRRRHSVNDAAGIDSLTTNDQLIDGMSPITIDRQSPKILEKLNLFDLQTDAILDPSIVLESQLAGIADDPQNILLTGATGFLGAFLLDRLLKSTQANIYCLIRCPNITVGTQKLQQNLARYSLTSAAQSSRAIVVKGDLAQPLFGMSNLEFQQLASQIDLIYHSGAFVNLLYPYAALRDPNVIGTQEILRLASQVKLKPVHFISTLDVFQSAHHTQMDACLEDDDFPLNGTPESGYAQSKWVAEKLVKTANERGIPTCIYRPGMIIGDSQTGISNTEDQIGRLIKGLIQLGSAPTLALQMHLTPVDYVSQAIVQIAQQPSAWGKAFHLTNAQSLSLAQLVQEIQFQGYQLRSISYDQWLKALLAQQFGRDNALNSLIPLLTSPSAAYSNYLEVLDLGKVDCQNTLAGLVGTAIDCPTLDSALLSNYFAYFRQSGFLEDPQQTQVSASTALTLTT